MNCLEALVGLRLPTPRLKTKTEKEGEEYIDFYWKFEAAKKDEVSRTLKRNTNVISDLNSSVTSL